mgnify:CR=1 FL=1
MIKKLKAMNNKHQELEMTLKGLINRPYVNELEIKELKKKKLQIKDTIMIMVKSKKYSKKNIDHNAHGALHA